MIRITYLEKLIFTFIFFIFILISFRVFYSGSIRYIFLLWNIFLAWIPFRISIMFRYVSGKLFGILLFIWLLFFPNALYIITDLVHLNEDTAMPVWYDAVILFSSSLIGLVMAFISLYNVEIYFRNRLKIKFTGVMMSVFIFLGAFGVYLGRFLRWNSWDILTNPMSLCYEISIRIIRPVDHFRTWVITFLFAVFFFLVYYMARKISDIFLDAALKQNKSSYNL